MTQRHINIRVESKNTILFATFVLSFVNEQDVLSENSIEQMTDKNEIPIVGKLEKVV